MGTDELRIEYKDARINLYKIKKTVVKAQEENFDPEKGLAMAITKKALGNNGRYYETIKKWIKEEN